MIQALLIGDVANVNHAFDAATQIDERAKLRQARNRSFCRRTQRVLRDSLFPRIAQRLLQAQRDAFVRDVHAQDNGIHQFAFLHDVHRAHVALGPGHLRNVDQAFQTRLQFYERAKIGHASDLALDALTYLILLRHSRPRIGLQLLDAQRDLTLLAADLQDLDVHLIADLDDVRRLGAARIRHVGDMQQSVNATQVDERAEIGERTNRPAHYRAFLQTFKGLLLGLLLNFFQNDAPVNNQVFGFFVELGDAAFDSLPHQFRQVRHVAYAAARSRHERTHAYIDTQATLHRFGDDAGDGALVGKRRLEARPILGHFHLERGKQDGAILVAPTDGDHHLRTGLQPRVRRQDTIHLAADVDEHRVRGYRDNSAFHRPALGVVGFVEFREYVAKRGICGTFQRRVH